MKQFLQQINEDRGTSGSVKRLNKDSSDQKTRILPELVGAIIHTSRFLLLFVCNSFEAKLTQTKINLFLRTHRCHMHTLHFTLNSKISKQFAHDTTHSRSDVNSWEM